MKAKVLATNKVVDVAQQESNRAYFVDKDNNPYKVDELDFNVKLEVGKPFTDFPTIMSNLNELNESTFERDKDIFYRNLAGSLLKMHFQSNTKFDNEVCAQIITMVNTYKEMIG